MNGQRLKALEKHSDGLRRNFAFESLEKYKLEVSNLFEVSDYPYQMEAYFEEVGFLVTKKFVDIDIIVDRLGSYIISNWQKLEPWVLAIRKERADNTFGEHFEMLHNKTLAYMKKTTYELIMRSGK